MDQPTATQTKPHLDGRALFRGLRLYAGLIALIMISAFLSPLDAQGGNIFLDRGNLFDILRQVSINGILAVGMTLVILTGGIDLSVGSVLGLGCVIAAVLLNERSWTASAAWGTGALGIAIAGLAGTAAWRWLPGRGLARGLASLALGLGAGWFAARWAAVGIPRGMDTVRVLACVASVGLLAGLLNGALVAWGRLQPFIATLATMTSLWGAARLVSGEGGAVHTVEFGPGLADPGFDALGKRLWEIVPVPGLFFLGAALVAQIILRESRLGRALYATGGSEEATRLSGVSVTRIKLFVYAASGFLASIAGALYVADYDQGKPDAGRGLELAAIAAVVIGGTSLMGGRGSMMGTLVGVFTMGILTNFLQLRSDTIDSNWQLVLNGMVIALAVMFQEGRFQAWARQVLRACRGGER